MTFSRMEFSLKESIVYARENPVYGNIEADWNKFGRNISAKLFAIADKEVVEAITELTNHPPKTQALNAGTIVWVDKVNPAHYSRIQLLIQRVKDVRNNLFHGSKFTGTWEPDTSRNYQVVFYALTILKALVPLDADVQGKFNEPLP